MFRSRFLLPGGVALALFCTSCADFSKPSNKVSFYTLEYAAQPPTDLKPLSWVLRVEHFSSSPLYGTENMVYREKPFKKEAYAFYQWRAKPEAMVAYFLMRDLQQSNLFKAVLPAASVLPATHLIFGNVDEFLESDREEAWQALLAVTIVLRAEGETDIQKSILLQKSYTATETCKLKNPQAVAEAMSRAMAQVSRQIMLDIHQALSAATP